MSKDTMKAIPTYLIRTGLALVMLSGALAQTNIGSKDQKSPTQPSPAQAGEIAQANKDQTGFFFPGGTPRQFLDALQKHYKVEWSSVAEIPAQMETVRIPALRIDRESLKAFFGNQRRGGFGGRARGGAQFGGGAPGSVDDQEDRPIENDTARSLEALVSLYSRISNVKRELGQLVVEGDFVKPSVVMFVSRNVSPGPEIKVKAFPLRGIPEKEWDAIEITVENELKQLGTAQRESRTGEAVPQVQVALHRGIGLLVVRAPEAVLETVESIVSAWHANQKVIESHPKL